MTLEQNLYPQAAEALISLSGGSVVILGLICLIGLAILFHKLGIGFSTGVTISTFVLGILSMTVDSNTIGTTTLPFNFFQIGYMLIMFGMAWFIAHAILRR